MSLQPVTMTIQTISINGTENCSLTVEAHDEQSGRTLVRTVAVGWRTALDLVQVMSQVMSGTFDGMRDEP